MASFAPVPVFDGKPENFRSFLQEVELWLMVTQLPPSRRAPALALEMDKKPRELCLTIGVDELKSDDGVEKILDMLRKHIAPDAHDSAFRDVVDFAVLIIPSMNISPSFRWRYDEWRLAFLWVQPSRRLRSPLYAYRMRVSPHIKCRWC